MKLNILFLAEASLSVSFQCIDFGDIKDWKDTLCSQIKYFGRKYFVCLDVKLNTLFKL